MFLSSTKAKASTEEFILKWTGAYSVDLNSWTIERTAILVPKQEFDVNDFSFFCCDTLLEFQETSVANFC